MQVLGQLASNLSFLLPILFQKDKMAIQIFRLIFMLSLLRLLFAFGITCNILNASSQISLPLPLTAEAALLINAETGTVLYEKNAHQKYYPSSTIKIATALYALKQKGDSLDVLLTAEQDAVGSVSEEKMCRSGYTLPAHWLTHGASHIALKRGEILSFKDLLYGLLIASGADAANVIAGFVSGTISTFTQEVNAYLKEIGCSDTTVKNPHGLFHPDQVTTAHDLALMTQEAMKIPLFREIVKSPIYFKPATNKQPAVPFPQTNQLLRKGPFHYPQAIGVKTGNLEVAHNLVAAAVEGDRTLIAVVLKCESTKSRFKDAADLFKAAFAEKKETRVLFPKGLQKTICAVKGIKKGIQTSLNDAILISYYPSEEPEIRCFVEWETLEPPIQEGQQVGLLTVLDKTGKELARAPLLSHKEIEAGVWVRLSEGIKGLFSLKKIGVLSLLVFVGVGLLYFGGRRE